MTHKILVIADSEKLQEAIALNLRVRLKPPLSKSRRATFGQGMVEFALILPLMILLSAGIVEFGRLLAIYSGLSNASREATRWGTAVNLNGSTPYYQDCSGMREAAKRTSVLLALSNSDITVQYDHGSGSAFATCVQNTEPSPAVVNGDRIIVTVVGHYAPIMPLLPMLQPFDITFVSARSVFPNIIVGTPYSGVTACYTLSVVAGTGGTVSTPTSNCSGGKFSGGVSFSATANTGYVFSNWTNANGVIVGTANPLVYSIGSDSVITANFTPICYTLTTAATDGSIIASPAQNCSGGYTYNTTVSLTANGNSGYSFTSWSGDLTGSTNPSSVVMTANRSVTASFQVAPCYTLTVTVPQVGGVTPGSVNQNPTTNCTGGKYNQNTGVVLTAQPLAGFQFSGWTGAVTSSSNPITATMSANKTYTANFTALPCYTITPSTSPTTVTGGTFSYTTSQGTSQASGCSGKYPQGTTVTFTATPNTGYSLSGWSGAISGITNPQSFSLTANSTVTATFVAACYTLTLSASPASGLSSFTTTPQNCSGGYTYGTNVSVTPNAASGYAFNSWSGAITGSSNPGTIHMTANYSAAARFIALCVKASTITSPSSNNIKVDYSNYSLAIRTLTKVIISWSSDKLTNASSFGTSALWSDPNGINFSASPYTIDSSNWNGSADRGMLDLTTKSLSFSFNKPVSGTTYSITTTFDDGCAATTASRTFP